MLEEVNASQLLVDISAKSIFDHFQSGFRALYTTETALVKVTNDLLIATDKDECSSLVLQDMSLNFDTVVHPILL